MKKCYDFNRMLSVAKNILDDSWIVQYVNVETSALELRAYNKLHMCIIVVENDNFDDPLVNYYDYKEENNHE